MQPEILFMDEPFSALDEMTRIQMQKELLRIWMQKKFTILFVTHSIDSAITLADRIAILSPRPSKIKKIIEVPLKHPRNITSTEFEKIKNRVLAEFGIKSFV